MNPIKPMAVEPGEGGPIYIKEWMVEGDYGFIKTDISGGDNEI